MERLRRLRELLSPNPHKASTTVVPIPIDTIDPIITSPHNHAPPPPVEIEEVGSATMSSPPPQQLQHQPDTTMAAVSSYDATTTGPNSPGGASTQSEMVFGPNGEISFHNPNDNIPNAHNVPVPTIATPSDPYYNDQVSPYEPGEDDDNIVEGFGCSMFSPRCGGKDEEEEDMDMGGRADILLDHPPSQQFSPNSAVDPKMMMNNVLSPTHVPSPGTSPQQQQHYQQQQYQKHEEHQQPLSPVSPNESGSPPATPMSKASRQDESRVGSVKSISPPATPMSKASGQDESRVASVKSLLCDSDDDTDDDDNSHDSSHEPRRSKRSAKRKKRKKVVQFLEQNHTPLSPLSLQDDDFSPRSIDRSMLSPRDDEDETITLEGHSYDHEDRISSDEEDEEDEDDEENDEEEDDDSCYEDGREANRTSSHPRATITKSAPSSSFSPSNNNNVLSPSSIASPDASIKSPQVIPMIRDDDSEASFMVLMRYMGCTPVAYGRGKNGDGRLPEGARWLDESKEHVEKVTGKEFVFDGFDDDENSLLSEETYGERDEMNDDDDDYDDDDDGSYTSCDQMVLRTASTYKEEEVEMCIDDLVLASPPLSPKSGGSRSSRSIVKSPRSPGSYGSSIIKSPRSHASSADVTSPVSPTPSEESMERAIMRRVMKEIQKAKAETRLLKESGATKTKKKKKKKLNLTVETTTEKKTKRKKESTTTSTKKVCDEKEDTYKSFLLDRSIDKETVEIKDGVISDEALKAFLSDTHAEEESESESESKEEQDEQEEQEEQEEQKEQEVKEEIVAAKKKNVKKKPSNEMAKLEAALEKVSLSPTERGKDPLEEGTPKPLQKKKGKKLTTSKSVKKKSSSKGKTAVAGGTDDENREEQEKIAKSLLNKKKARDISDRETRVVTNKTSDNGKEKTKKKTRAVLTDVELPQKDPPVVGKTENQESSTKSSAISSTMTPIHPDIIGTFVASVTTTSAAPSPGATDNNDNMLKKAKAPGTLEISPTVAIAKESTVDIDTDAVTSPPSLEESPTARSDKENGEGESPEDASAMPSPTEIPSGKPSVREVDDLLSKTRNWIKRHNEQTSNKSSGNTSLALSERRVMGNITARTVLNPENSISASTQLPAAGSGSSSLSDHLKQASVTIAENNNTADTSANVAGDSALRGNSAASILSTSTTSRGGGAPKKSIMEQLEEIRAKQKELAMRQRAKQEQTA